MKPIKLPEFKIAHVLSAIFYLLTTVTIIQLVNYIGVFMCGLEFLGWWPLGRSMLFGLGGVPDPTLTAIVSGLAVELTVPGLASYVESHWLTRSGLAIVTSLIFLTMLGLFRRMLDTLDVQQPFDPANIRRVQFIIVLLLLDIFALDYLRTQSMQPVKTLVNQMGASLTGTDSSYQNADAYAYLLLLLLLTLVAIFRRGLVLYRQQLAMEKQLYQKQKLEALGTLASGIAHDFSNIITSITGYAELAKSESNKNDIQFALDQVLDSTNRAKQLTRQIRAMGLQQPDPGQNEPIDLKQEVDEFLLSIAPSIKPNIKVVKQFDSTTSFAIHADPTKIYQILLNLCTNALQAMQTGPGQLTIAIEPQNRLMREGFCLSVKDNGCGMSETQLQHVFEPYFTTRQQSGGTGLGLSLCYSIVQSQGGQITLNSTLNQGSCFEVWLPKTDNTHQKTTQFNRVNKALQLMVIDDDRAIVTLAKRRLSGLGYQVEGFGDALVALEAFKQSPEKFDLVISDFNMPQLNGVALADQVQAIDTNKPVIIITATPEKVAFNQQQKLRQVISKPIAFSELDKCIQQLLAI